MLCLTLTIGAANAQKKYSDVKAEGKALFDKKDYAGALKRFEYAKYKSIDRKDHIIDPELKRMMTVCQTKVSRKKTTGGATPTRTTTSSNTVKEPKAKIEDFKVYNGEHNGELGVRIKCSFYAYNMQGNEAVTRMSVAHGCKVEGRLEQHIYKYGKFHDVNIVGITRDHWEEFKKTVEIEKYYVE